MKKEAFSMEHIDQFITFCLHYNNSSVISCFNAWVSYSGIILPFREAVEFIRVADNITHAPKELMDCLQNNTHLR